MIKKLTVINLVLFVLISVIISNRVIAQTVDTPEKEKILVSMGAFQFFISFFPEGSLFLCF